MVDNVALYLRNILPTEEWLEKQPGVESCEIKRDESGYPEQYFIGFSGVLITMNVMKTDELPDHIAGFSNYVMQLHQKNPSEETVSILENIVETKSALGCVIDPGLDEKGYIGGFYLY